MLNRDHTSLETPPTPTAMPFTIRLCLLYYIHLGLAWFAETSRRHRHTGYDHLGDAFTTLPSKKNRGLNFLTHIPPGGACLLRETPVHGGAFGTPRARARAQARACARTRARACAYARRTLPRPGTHDGGPSSWLVPGDSSSLPRKIDK